MNNKMNGILESLGVDPFYLFIVVFVLLAVLFILYVLLNERYRKLQRSYATFMKGKNGKNLEKRKCSAVKKAPPYRGRFFYHFPIKYL